MPSTSQNIAAFLLVLSLLFVINEVTISYNDSYFKFRGGVKYREKSK